MPKLQRVPFGIKKEKIQGPCRSQHPRSPRAVRFQQQKLDGSKSALVNRFDFQKSSNFPSPSGMRDRVGHWRGQHPLIMTAWLYFPQVQTPQLLDRPTDRSKMAKNRIQKIARECHIERSGVNFPRRQLFWRTPLLFGIGGIGNNRNI